MGSLCASLILGIDNTSGGIRVETSFGLHRSKTLYITWGGLLERHVKLLAAAFHMALKGNCYWGYWVMGLSLNKCGSFKRLLGHYQKSYTVTASQFYDIM